MRIFKKIISINENKNCFLEKINKINKKIKQIQFEQRRPQIDKIINEGEVVIDTTEK